MAQVAGLQVPDATCQRLVLGHCLTSGCRVRKPFTGSPRATRRGDPEAGASGSVVSLRLFLQPEIYGLTTH